MRGAFILFAGAGLALAACEAATTSPPSQATAAVNSVRVFDRAGLLSPAQEARLIRLSERLEQRTSDQLVIVTVDTLHDRPIEEYTRELANEWGIGEAHKDNGVVLLIAPNQRRTRIEVGAGLEPILTNSRASEIIEADLLPMFRQARWFEGIEAASESISETLIAQADTPRGASR